MIAFAYRSGVIGIERRCPRGALTLVEAPGRRLRPAVEVVARHACDGTTLLVPGIPEAENDVEALSAAKRFQEMVRKRLLPPAHAIGGAS